MQFPGVGWMDNQDRVLGTIPPDGGCWPTMEQELLLRASLLEGRDAFDAWKEWESKVDIDLLDQGSRRLLPLLYRNLRSHGVENSLMGMFKGIYRLTWFSNQMLFRKMSTLLHTMNDSGIQTMVFKGAALVLLHYKDYGLRPMDDFDVLIRSEHVMPAFDLLTKLGWKPMTKVGWRPERGPLKAFPEKLLSIRHAMLFINAEGRQFDLHWHVSSACCYENADDDYWEGATKINFNEVATHALDPTDELFHICVHGSWWNPVPSIRWVADAIIIMNNTKSDIDWKRLTSQAQKRRLVLQTRNALCYLRDVFNAPVPQAILQGLQNMTVSSIERMEYRIRSRPPRLTGAIPEYWFSFLRSSQLESCAVLRPNFAGFPRFLKHVWGLDSLWQLPLYTFSKGMNRVVKAIAGK